jgi:uncharacterized membrane protein YgcG
MKPLAALAAATLALGAALAPALAADSFVHDDAGLLSAATVTQLNPAIGDFYAQTHKEVVVDIVPSLDGSTAPAAAERVFAQHRVNGVLIYIAKAEKKIEIVPDVASRRFFPAGSFDPIYASMKTAFRAGDYDGGVTTAVSLIVNTYRGHESALRERATTYVPAPTTQVVRSNTGGFSMGFIWWLIIFFVVRGIFRAMVGPRMYPPGYGGGPGPGGPGPYGGGPGYGPGYGGYGPGYGGGGGGFWSGLLGGLGGAWLGNEMFGGNRETTIIEQPGGYADVGGVGGGQDASGFQSDPGQADMGNAAGGGWGDSGGGWGGGGDSGGGWGGGDSGGGGSDSGGGW